MRRLLDGLFESAGKKLGGYTKDSKKYQETLKNLILEGLYALNEKKVLVRCRKADEELTKKAAGQATEEYKKNMKGKDVEVVVDTKERLAEGV